MAKLVFPQTTEYPTKATEPKIRNLWENWSNFLSMRFFNAFYQDTLTLRCIVDSVGPVLSLLSRPFLYFDDPRGSNTIANPNIINANTTQLKTTIPVRHRIKLWENRKMSQRYHTSKIFHLSHLAKLWLNEFTINRSGYVKYLIT